ncbi:MAG: hypothetical protein ACYDHX_08055 [Methanothrix sp.]
MLIGVKKTSLNGLKIIENQYVYIAESIKNKEQYGIENIDTRLENVALIKSQRIVPFILGSM